MTPPAGQRQGCVPSTDKSRIERAPVLEERCARCHDHKLDAISQRDSYALAGVFMTPRWTSRVIDSPGKCQRQIEELTRLRQHARDGGLQVSALRQRLRDGRLPTQSPLRPVADLLGQVAWLETRIEASEAAAETVLGPENEGRTLLASGDVVPPTDTYSVRFSTPAQDASLLRLEAVADASGGGPGRTTQGNFVLSKIRVEVKPRGAR